MLLTALRAALAPVVLLLAWHPRSQRALGLCLVVAILSDIFDEIVARRLDSAADSLFHFAAAIAAWQIHPDAITKRWLEWPSIWGCSPT